MALDQEAELVGRARAPEGRVAGGAEELARGRVAAVGEDRGEALDAVLLHGAYIGSTQGFPELFPPAWTAGILAGMDPTSLEFWEWFYVTGNEGKSLSAEQMQRAIEERWHPDLVLIQDPKFPGTGASAEPLRCPPVPA